MSDYVKLAEKFVGAYPGMETINATDLRRMQVYVALADAGCEEGWRIIPHKAMIERTGLRGGDYDHALHDLQRASLAVLKLAPGDQHSLLVHLATEEVSFDKLTGEQEAAELATEVTDWGERQDENTWRLISQNLANAIFGKRFRFRVWDYKSRQMSYGTPLLTRNTIELVFDYFAQGTTIFSDLRLMEWTGLKDKEGKPIYERDLLEYPPGKHGLVLFHSGAFVVVEMGTTNEDALGIIASDAKVYGNMYEDPQEFAEYPPFPIY